MKKKKILDVGCGEGFNTFCLSKRNESIGIDISNDAIAIARKRFPRVTYLVMDAENLDFAQGLFDEVYAIDVLEHVQNLEKILEEIKRVLKPGGKFIANIPYWKSETWLSRLRPAYFSEIHHLRIFGETQLENLMKEKSFTLIKKKRKDFINHIFQYYMFKRKEKSTTQLGIGNWRDNLKTRALFAFLLFFDVRLFKTPLKYIPFWIATLPVGICIDSIGNRFFPKSQWYEFKNE